jgi:pimeloyl-ACP methyl ester carboxylesterase
MLSPKTFADRPEIVARQREIMLACPPGTIANACAAMRDREDFTTELALLPCPLQIIVGEDDAIASADVARAMHEAAKGSRLDVIPNAGHMAPLEQPAAVASAITSFATTVRRLPSR